MVKIISEAHAGLDVLSFLNDLPSFLFFTYSFIHQVPTKCQESHRGDFHSRLRGGSDFALQCLKKRKPEFISFPAVSPSDFLSIHLFIHLLTPKLSICFVQVLCLGTGLRRSTMKKMKNACPAAHSSWNPRGHQERMLFPFF